MPDQVVQQLIETQRLHLVGPPCPGNFDNITSENIAAYGAMFKSPIGMPELRNELNGAYIRTLSLMLCRLGAEKCVSRDVSLVLCRVRSMRRSHL